MSEQSLEPTFTIYADFSSVQRATKLLLDERVPLPEDHFIGSFETPEFITLLKKYIFDQDKHNGQKSFRIDLADCSFIMDMLIEAMGLYNPETPKDIVKALSKDSALIMDIYKGICDELSVFFVYTNPADTEVSLRFNMQSKANVSSDASIAELNRVNNP